jgi:hypothetical protein
MWWGYDPETDDDRHPKPPAANCRQPHANFDVVESAEKTTGLMCWTARQCAREEGENEKEEEKTGQC